MRFDTNETRRRHSALVTATRQTSQCRLDDRVSGFKYVPFDSIRGTRPGPTTLVMSSSPLPKDWMQRGTQTLRHERFDQEATENSDIPFVKNLL